MRKLLIVSIVAAVLGSYIYFLEVPAAKEELLASKFFGQISSSELQSVSVESTAGSYELINESPQKAKPIDPSKGVGDSLEEQTGDLPPLTWHLSDLKTAILDRATVEGVLQAVTEFSFKNKVESPETDLSTYGLLNPSATVIAKVDGKTTKIFLGEKNDFIDGRYAKLDGDATIYVVDESLYGEVVKAKEVLRSKTPIAFSDSSVKRIVLQDDQKIIQIEPQADKSFKIIEPVSAKASSFAVFDLYRALRNLQAEQFIDGVSNVDDYGFDEKNPKQVRIHRSVGEDLVISFGSKDNALYCTINAQPTVYKVVGDPRPSLFKSVLAFRDAQPFKFDPYLATSVSITKEKNEILSLRTDQGGWIFSAHRSKADTPFVREFLKTLGDLTATDFLPVGEVEWANSPLIKVDVEIDEDGRKTAKTLLIGEKRAEKGFPALVQGSNEGFFISEDSVKQITPAEEKFKIVPTTLAPTAQAPVEP